VSRRHGAGSHRTHRPTPPSIHLPRPRRSAPHRRGVRHGGRGHLRGDASAIAGDNALALVRCIRQSGLDRASLDTLTVTVERLSASTPHTFGRPAPITPASVAVSHAQAAVFDSREMLVKHWNEMSARWYQDYERGRPRYPRQVVHVPGLPTSGTVLEVGAGTGKLTRLLVRVRTCTRGRARPRHAPLVCRALPSVPASLGGRCQCRLLMARPRDAMPRTTKPAKKTPKASGIPGGMSLKLGSSTSGMPVKSV